MLKIHIIQIKAVSRLKFSNLNIIAEMFTTLKLIKNNVNYL